jgi:hypothetical protein
MDFDPLGNLYIVDGNDRLIKYDSTGHMLFNVVNNNLGQVHSLDVGNPFKTMTFYRDQQTILIYDRTLSEIQRIRLSDWDLHDVTAACLAPDNAIWVFDGLKKVLVKMNPTGDAILTSDPFDILRPASARPDFIYDADHFLVLKETGFPITIFDDFGKYLYAAGIKESESFSVSNQYIVMSSGSSIGMYDIVKRQMQTPISVKENLTGKRIYFFANRFFISDEKGIYMLYP